MLIVSILAFFVVTFLVIAIAVVIIWMAMQRISREESDAALGERSGAPTQEAAPAEEDSPLFRTERLSTVDFFDKLLTRFDIIELLRERLQQAEMDWSVGRVLVAMLLIGTVALAVFSRILPFLAAFLLAGALSFAPYGYVLWRRNKRFVKFRENFPDALDSLARALRAGYPLSAAMELIWTEAVPPVAGEIRKTSAEANLGMGWDRALNNLCKRVPLLEVNLFTAAVQLHSRTGGKLSEVISGLAETMRESVALQGEVRALAAHGRLTGVILTILPIGIAGMMMWVSPDYMLVLLQYPNGKYLIMAAIGCLIAAQLIIRKIVDIKV